MNTSDVIHAGEEMYSLANDLYPLCRSITGDGVRRTLQILKNYLPLEIIEVPSGTQVFDWVVPEEWNIREAWIKDKSGRKVVDFMNHNLHLVGYSIPVSCIMKMSDLRHHLFSLPEQPELIPYRTSYYKRDWGFCLCHKDLNMMRDDEYEVFIDSSHHDGSLTYGEKYIPGDIQDELLISCHICHPSLANDNVAGMCVAAEIGKYLERHPRRLSYRVLFIPGTIGSIAWLALNQTLLSGIKHGLVITCAGDSAPLTYKRSRQGDASIDRVMQYVLRMSGHGSRIIDFYPYGYDERQFCSPGINLPVGCLMRSQHGTFPEYHTSADSLEFIKPEKLVDTLARVIETIDILEKNTKYLNSYPMCEPRLAKYGIYDEYGGHKKINFNENALLWVLNLSDGNNDVLNIAERSGLPFDEILQAAEKLEQVRLIKKLES